MILAASVALLWMGIVLFLVYLLWNPKKAREMNKLWWLIPAGAVIIAICWLSGLADGTSLLK